MKVCIIVPLIEPWVVGGTEVYASALIREISRNHEVVVITQVGSKPRKSTHQVHNLKIIEIKPTNIVSYYDLNRPSGIGSFRTHLWHLFDFWNVSSYKKIKKILIDEKPDLVHTIGIRGFSLSLFSAIQKLQIPHVHVILDFGLISRWTLLFTKGKIIQRNSMIDSFYRSLSKKISSHVDAVIAPSKFIMDFHEKMGFFNNSKKYVIPLACDISTKTLPKVENTKEFLCMGRAIEMKGFQIAIKAFEKINDKKARLHIIGDGVYLNTLKKMAKEDERIIFHGFLWKKNREPIMNRCSFIIVPSIGYETYGLSTLDGMIMGLIPIASNIGGIPEIIKDGQDGFLFKPGNIESLQSKMEDLINEKSDFKTLSKNAIQKASEYNPEKHLKSVLDVYSKTVNLRGLLSKHA